MDDIAERGELGALRQSIRLRSGAARAVLATVFAVVALSLLALAVTRSDASPYVGAAVCAALAVFCAVRWRVTAPRVRIDAFEDGFRVVDAKGGVICCRWRDLLVQNRYGEFVFWDRDGREVLRSEGFRGKFHWGPRFCAEVVRTQLPYVIADLEGGGAVSFGGGLEARRDCLVHRGVEMPWVEMEKVLPWNGALAVVRRGERRPTALVPMGALVNVGVLYGTIRHFSSQARA